MSGLLYESNLLMYDRTNESLWSQSRGEAVVGEFLGTELELLPMQTLSFADVKANHPDALVLSRDTGHTRDYQRNPYAGYEDNDTLFSDVSVTDTRFATKEPMYVFAAGDTSVAFPYESLSAEGATTKIGGHTIEATRDGSEIYVTVDGEPAPGYIEMWFSWITQHQEDGKVWELE